MRTIPRDLALLAFDVLGLSLSIGVCRFTGHDSVWEPRTMGSRRVCRRCGRSWR